MSRSLIYHTQLATRGNVQVESSDGISVTIELDQISKSGMSLQCNQETLATLFPKSPTFAPKQAVQLATSFGLPEVGKIEMQCDVISVRRLSRDSFELHLKFHQDNQRALAIIDKYVERKLRSTVSKKSNVSPIEPNNDSNNTMLAMSEVA